MLANMIFFLNKLVWVCGNPTVIGLLILLAAIILRKRSRKFGLAALLLVFCWFYLLSTSSLSKMIGWTLEHEYPQMNPEDCPLADAIVCLGGGIQKQSRSVTNYPDFASSADRVYLSALLWKAGRSPFIITSCSGVTNADNVVLRDLGVPAEAIITESNAKTTEENAKFIQQLLTERAKKKDECVQQKTCVLLVTSAWHMKRSLYMFHKYAPDIVCIPVACDFEVMTKDPPSLRGLLPDPGSFAMTSCFLHEWLGIIGYKYLRK